MRFKHVLIVIIFLLLAGFIVFSFNLRNGDNYTPKSFGRNILNLARRSVAEISAQFYSFYDPFKDESDNLVFGKLDFDKTLGYSGQEEVKKAFSENAYFETDSLYLKNGDVVDVTGMFDFESFDQPLLDSLRTLYSLDTLFTGIETDYQGFINLRNWISWKFKQRTESRITTENIDFNFNALDILYRTKREKFWCSEYATTMVQCLASVGYTARYVMINNDIAGHVLLEAWSDDYQKWVAVDPFFMFQVLRDGKPLNALEVHELSGYDDLSEGVDVITEGQVTREKNEEEFYISLFLNFAVRMRNDWYGNPYPRLYPKSNSVMNAIEWQDERTHDNIRYSWESSNPNDLYWPLNNSRIYIKLSDTSPRSIKLSFDTFTPSFSHFRLNENGFVSRLVDSNFDWEVNSGFNHLSVKAVNVMGVEGDSAYIDLICR